MILSDTAIKHFLNTKQLTITPFIAEHIQPASIDLCLGTLFLSTDAKRMPYISLEEEIRYERFEGKEITISPHSFILASTQEYIQLPHNLTAFVEGRSSIGRIGLFIQNAGWVDPGFQGRLTLELYNANALPIRLASGRRICQLVFCRMEGHAQKPYQGKYQHQASTTGSKIHQDADSKSNDAKKGDISRSSNA